MGTWFDNYGNIKGLLFLRHMGTHMPCHDRKFWRLWHSGNRCGITWWFPTSSTSHPHVALKIAPMFTHTHLFPMTNSLGNFEVHSKTTPWNIPWYCCDNPSLPYHPTVTIVSFTGTPFHSSRSTRSRCHRKCSSRGPSAPLRPTANHSLCIIKACIPTCPVPRVPTVPGSPGLSVVHSV